MRVLKKGLNGPDVERWQRFLISQGFDLGTRLGTFGDRTHAATREFQQRNGLDVDGRAGKGTIDKARELGFEDDDTIPTNPTDPPTQVVGDGSSLVTDDVLKQVMPNLRSDRRARFLPFLTAAMAEFSVDTPLRAAAFLAQVAHESGQFRFMEEIWGPTPAQIRYEPPGKKARDLGNDQTGDGKRFKGRGPIQITGRANYRHFGDKLGVDIVTNPPLAATDAVAFRIAGCFWKQKGLNELADKQDFREITRRINGGFNGLADRKQFYERAKRVLGIPAAKSATPSTPQAKKPAKARAARSGKR